MIFTYLKNQDDNNLEKILKNDTIEQAVLANESYVKSETLTNELIFVSEIKNGTEIEFDELKTIILISK